VDVRHITADGIRRCPSDEIEALLAGPGLVWIDVKYWDADTASGLAKRLRLHERAVHECAVRNPVAKVHTYPDQAFVVLHAPVQGRGGHVHFVELDQFVGPNWVLTVHGPMNVAVELDAAYVETTAVARRLDKGTLRPARACELSGALVNAVADRMRDYLTALTQDVWHLERQVTSGHVGDTEKFLEELFGVRHGLLAVHTMAVSSKEVYGRMIHRTVFGAAGAAGLVDLEDQFRRIAAMADGEREYLQGVIEYYRTRTGTKMAIAAERLAVIAAVTLPVTALSSIMGMNVIVNDATRTGQLALLLAVMLAMCVVLLIWTRRKGWW
jgi:Mg2+ and Co2+ transporter CorA